MNHYALFDHWQQLNEMYDNRKMCADKDYYASSDEAHFMARGISGSWMSFLDKESLALLEWYADHGAYDLTNNLHSTHVVEQGNKLEKLLSTAFTKSDAVVYRGIRHPSVLTEIDALKVGAVYTTPAFMSTSTHYAMAAQLFTSYNNPLVMAIKLPRGSNAAYIGVPNTANEFEAEILLNRHMKLKLVRKEMVVLADDQQGNADEDEIEHRDIKLYTFTLV